VLSRPLEGGDGGALLGPDDPVRLIRTSGTTGLPKQLMLTERVHERRIEVYVTHARLDDRSRFLITMPFTVVAVYHHAKACLHAGGTAIIADLRDRLDMIRVIEANAVTHVVLWPLHVKQTLDGLPPDFQKPHNLTVTSVGAAMAPSLRARLLARLATSIFDYYGSNESGFISHMPSDGSGGFGLLFPGLELEIVDENDVALPEGHVGKIRVKTEYMVESYWQDPEASRAMFREGWFYPGDLAALHAGVRLELVGRGDEILNVGGTKVSPAALEEWVAAHLPAGDIGVCTVRNADGVEEVCVGVVRPEIPRSEVLERVAFAFRSLQVGAFYVGLLGRIPRNAAGKIERDRLRGAIAAALKRPASDSAKG